MNCPKCNKGEIEAARACPYCGYRHVKAARPITLPFPPNENIVNFPAKRSPKSEDRGSRLRVVKEKPVPSWRQEVSLKVQEVLRAKQAKNAAAAAPGRTPASKAKQEAPKESSTKKEPEAPEQEVGRRKQPAPPVVESGRSATSPSGSREFLPDDVKTASKPVFQGSALELTRMHMDTPPLVPETPPSQSFSESGGTELPPRAPHVLLGPEALELEVDYPLQVPCANAHPSQLLPASPDRGMLLSRTLSGLIDFIVVLFSSIPFFFILVTVSGYDEIDEFSLGVLLGICLCLFTLYSVFFLAFSGQTVGMMITDLRVVSNQGGLPTYMRALNRVLTYLMSVGFLGLGLFWGLIDRRSRCLHDLLSSTSVVRVEQ